MGITSFNTICQIYDDIDSSLSNENSSDASITESITDECQSYSTSNDSYDESLDLDERSTIGANVEDYEEIKSIVGPLTVKTFKDTKLGPKSAFIKIRVKNVSQPVIIKKSTLCWLLRTNGKRITTDRLRRFHL